MQTSIELTDEDFWHSIPILFDPLNNKKGASRFVYLFLLHYFYHNHQFPDFNNVPDELLQHGITLIAPTLLLEELRNCFQNDRQIYRYIEEIRAHFGYRLLLPDDLINIRRNFSVLFSSNGNKNYIKEILLKELDKQKIERPTDTEVDRLINKIQMAEEKEIFAKINHSLTESNKNYIDNYILSSAEFEGVCQFLRQDFIDSIKAEMSHHITAFDEGFLNNELVNIGKRKGKIWIELTPLEKVEEPKFIQQLKEAVLAKWGVIDLLDILKEVDLREDFTNCFSTAGNREILDRETIRKRLLLCNFAIGTNAGLKRTAGASKGTVTFEELRHIRNFFLNKDDLREAINTVINGIFRIRNPKIWRAKSTVCAADSKQFGCFSKNLLTEWSPRHHNSGVMIYWHVSDQYICVYSQLKTCTSSEVASMLQGIMNQETEMEIESQYVDSHGQSELGFALSYLEKFDLLPRYKTIGNQKLYLPSDDFCVKNIKEITTRVIDWKLIAEQYDEMIKHAVALKIGTATADTIIRKFARSSYQHPTFKAFMELGKAVKTIFLCRYLHSVELRQQINAGLNIVENWNGANDFVYYGKSGEITSNCHDDQEISMLCLHLLQTCISYINTLLIENLFLDKYWWKLFKEEDYRALTALFYLHINPYGSFEVDLTKRLIIQPEINPTIEEAVT